jgi:hypothetical protein
MRVARARLGSVTTYAASLLIGAYGCSGGSCRACSPDKPAKDGEETAATEEDEDRPEDLEVPEGSDVEMLAAGSRPRVFLRVARWEGLRYRVNLRTSGTFGVAGQPAVGGPNMSMTFLYEVLRGSADPIESRIEGGVKRLIEERALLESAHLESNEVPPPVLADWNRALAGFYGSTLRQLTGETGGIEELKLELIGGQEPPPELKRATDAALELQRRFPFRLPPIPVGVGARWRFRENIVLNGVAAVQNADMMLRTFDDDKARIRLTVRLAAPRQSVPHPLEPGKTAMLDVFRGDGDGEITVDRLTGVPIKGRLATTARLTLRGDVAGQPAEVTVMGSNVVVSEATILGIADGGGQATGRHASDASADPEQGAER